MALIEINRNPDRRQLRTFGLAGLVALALLGGWTLWRGAIFGIHLGGAAQAVVVSALLCGGALFGLFSLAAPLLLKPFFTGLSVVGAPIGFAVSFLVMAILYYLIITPLGLFFRCTGRDPLERKFEPDRATYWVARDPSPPLKQYFRQH